ncbi:hypothetical protein RF11_08740 [Thelohanellus kitauei]|uniref:Uncharacterized protein n=1 Tax=Thelohanellus kitauei TaxID=669202 RepID=A0A0C2IKY4_THEKT|nr:hypothetical protein RF11_08740 [Thelohanellus kitauei]
MDWEGESASEYRGGHFRPLTKMDSKSPSKERQENRTITKFHPSSEIYLQKEMTKCASMLDVSYTASPPLFQVALPSTYRKRRPFIERFEFFFNHTNIHKRLRVKGLYGKFNIFVSLNVNPGSVTHQFLQPTIPKSQTSKSDVIKRLNELSREDNCLYNSKWGATVSLAGFANRVRKTLIRTTRIVLELQIRFKNVYRQQQSVDIMVWSSRCSTASPFGFNIIFKDVNEVIRKYMKNHSLTIIFYNQLQREHAYLFFRIANDLTEFALHYGSIDDLNFEAVMVYEVKQFGLVSGYEAQVPEKHPKSNILVWRSLSYHECLSVMKHGSTQSSIASFVKWLNIIFGQNNNKTSTYLYLGLFKTIILHFLYNTFLEQTFTE